MKFQEKGGVSDSFLGFLAVYASNPKRKPVTDGYRWKAGSEAETMAVSLGRSDVLGAQECDRAESPGSRDVSGSVFAPKPTKNRIRSYPMGRTVITRFYGDIVGVFTGLGGHPGCLSAYLRHL